MKLRNVQFLGRYLNFPDNSIVRRSGLLLCFMLPAAILNLAVVYVANFVLDSVHFGIFYLAITIVNVLFAPSQVLNLYYSRIFVQMASEHGEPAAIRAIARFAGRVIWFGLAVAIAATMIFWVFGAIINIQSYALVAIVVLIAYTSYVADTLRCGLQGLHRFFRLGLYSLSWMTTRFLLAVGGLYLTRTSWGGLTGIALSGLLVFFPTLAMLMALSTGDREPVDIQLPSPLRMIPLALSFTVYTAITYLDIVTSYLLLNKSALGVYSASSVLPKGILLFTTPIIQVAFPVMVRGGSAEIPGRALFMKGFLATVLIGGVALLLVWSTADYNCGSTYGIQTCDREIMGFALAGILPLMILRVLVIDQLSRRNDWHPLALLVPVALFAVYFLVSIRDIDHLAISFLVFGYATLAYYGAICFYSAIKQNSASTTFV